MAARQHIRVPCTYQKVRPGTFFLVTPLQHPVFYNLKFKVHPYSTTKIKTTLGASMKHILVCFLAFFCLANAQTKTFEYVGSNRCKPCHSKPEVGAQFAQWESTAHANSYKTLLTDESKSIASKMGLKTTPEKSPECLICHVTGWGTASGFKLDVPAEDTKAQKANDNLAAVGCESCHGPGSEYKSKKVKEAVVAGEITKASVGLIDPSEAACKVCHNPKSPTFKEFNWESMHASISHPNPANTH